MATPLPHAQMRDLSWRECRAGDRVCVHLGMGHGESLCTCVRLDVGAHTGVNIWSQAGYPSVCLYVSFLGVSALGGQLSGFT